MAEKKPVLEEIIRMTGPEAVKRAYEILGESAETEDIVQETFIKVYERLLRGEIIRHPRTYFFRVLKNLCADYRRQSRITVPDSVLTPRSDPALSPQERTIEAEEEECFRKLVDRLPPNQGKALILNHFERKTYREIARELGKTEKAVECLLAKARKQLRKILEKERVLAEVLRLLDREK
ncbi:MAG: RNA polymerase sigma factor [bacterium]